MKIGEAVQYGDHNFQRTRARRHAHGRSPDALAYMRITLEDWHVIAGLIRARRCGYPAWPIGASFVRRVSLLDLCPGQFCSVDA